MARKQTGVRDGHSHTYTDKVTSPNRSTQTSIDDGHSHKIVRDDAGRALRIARAEGHTHPLPTNGR